MSTVNSISHKKCIWNLCLIWWFNFEFVIMKTSHDPPHWYPYFCNQRKFNHRCDNKGSGFAHALHLRFSVFGHKAVVHSAAKHFCFSFIMVLHRSHFLIPATSILYDYCKISNIRHTKSPNLNVSRLVLQFSVPNPMKSGVKSRMKI